MGGSMRLTDQYAVTFEPIDIAWCITEVAREDVPVMLAEQRRFQLEQLRKRRKAQRKSRHLEIAKQPIMNLAYGAPLAQMRMRHRLFQREDGRRRDACGA